MGKIKVMDEVLANKIAAGEVVERIASALKELVENSIDAESKVIKIELKESGTKSIKVVDDGSGMNKEDAILCFSRHATSKIKTENDLYFINTLGFRGEALAAISSVSEVTLDTFDGTESTKITVKAGKFVKEETGSKRKGTIIEVKDLFYNTPARLKFMKNPHTELAHCTSLIERLALSHPDISFTLINDDKELIKTSGGGELYKVIHEIFGYNTSKNMVKIHNENYDYEIDGYISNINISKSTRNSMITLVNGRVVTNKELNKTIKEAYHTALAENKFPVIVLNIETDPTLIDVNIHPTKQDIKFSKLESLQDLVFTTIKDTLFKIDNTFKAYKETKPEKETKEEPQTQVNYENLKINFEIKETDSNEYEYIASTEEIKEDNILIKPVGLALGTYLIAHDEDIMYMIDIHAANERINYEKYLNALKEKQIYTTGMLFPMQIEFTKNEYLIIKDNLNILTDLGFKIDEFGINTFRITEHPTWLKEGYEEESTRRIFDLITQLKGDFDRVKFNEKTAITLACKMSIKANSSLSYIEQEELINKLFKCEFPYTCPHGRPTIIKYPIYELEKLFKRASGG